MISLSRRVVPAAQILLLLASSPAFAADLNPAALAYKSPDQLKWRDPTGAAGINQAVLVGDPEKPGLYVVMNRFKPGNFSRPHFHPNDRFITVMIPTSPARCRPARSSRISPSRCTGTAPRTRKPG